MNIEKIVSSSLKDTGFKRLIVAVSGGADSVAMLHLLSQCRVELIAAHCNFHLRGEESNRDADYVGKICSELGVKLETIDFDVEDYLAGHAGVSVEMACRHLRYDWFFSLLSEFAADRVATAHNADDNIETLLLNLLRGSGTSGLKGMIPDNGKVWRPLLSVHRKDIEAYLDDNNISFVTDSTNLESNYRRNFLRNEVLPLIREKWEGADKALDRSIEILRRENLVVESAVAHALPPDGAPLEASSALSFPDPQLLIRRYIAHLNPFTTTAKEVVEAMKAAKPAIKVWKLKKGSLLLKNNKLFCKNDV
ncbi:MAG: tRNA lysidine(34) synthetase TilS [Muribaculaceae bacterium]|nr:tRNA lysidine(34) synthetase TilS [Muribaculaceae bacterium]MDE6755013.1 tRNA lysidine(34) synthetase TilS [Muribaculaceae bacterium]